MRLLHNQNVCALYRIAQTVSVSNATINISIAARSRGKRGKKNGKEQGVGKMNILPISDGSKEDKTALSRLRIRY